MQYEEFVELAKAEGLPLKATADLLYVFKLGTSAHVLVKYGKDKSGEDVLMCYFDKEGQPLDEITPDQVKAYVRKWKEQHP